MTRRSERELERIIDGLDHSGSGGEWDDVQIVFVDSETGEYRTPDGALVDPDAVDPIMTIGGEPPGDKPGGHR